VATAVLEGADAVMLSGETAMGLFPVETVQMMKRVILYTEREELAQQAATTRHLEDESGRGNAISAAAVVLAHQLPAKVIIAETATGQTARNISSLRPVAPIIMVTHQSRVYHQLAIVWGGKSYLHDQPAEAAEHVTRQLRAAGNIAKGDALVVASGNQPGVPGGTSNVSIRVVQ
jgi:pyruvate kinase